jgi:hypothetical protein
MEFSEAVRLGATMFPREKWDRRYYCACAARMALEAIGFPDLDNPIKIVEGAQKEWPWLEDQGIVQLSFKFTDVCEGRLTFDEFVRWTEEQEALRPAHLAPLEEIILVG